MLISVHFTQKSRKALQSCSRFRDINPPFRKGYSRKVIFRGFSPQKNSLESLSYTFKKCSLGKGRDNMIKFVIFDETSTFIIVILPNVSARPYVHQLFNFIQRFAMFTSVRPSCPIIKPGDYSIELQLLAEKVC